MRLITLALGLMIGLSGAAMARTLKPDSLFKHIIWFSQSSLVQSGAKALERGDTLEGIQLTEEALADELAPRDFVWALNNLCVGYANLGLYDHAIDYCNRALKRGGNDWRLFNNRANANFRRGDIDAAITDYQRALRYRPNSEILKANLSSALQHKKLGDSSVFNQRSVAN